MKIDKDISMPNGSLRSKWSMLEAVGDSVFFEGMQSKKIRTVSANNWGRLQKPPRKFRAYYETETGSFTHRSGEGIVGVRLWRVE